MRHDAPLISVFLRRKMPQKHSKTDLLYHRKIGVQAAIEGDIGLKKLVERHLNQVRTVEGDEGSILDIDSEEDVAEIARRGFTIEKSQG